ncbi:hypothetical protein F8M41_020071 [Gigaspora margarita]|uniref:Uncharacterized protein n=1 Tax=Gigaspora margarita TaxID=4874 RepID=A0A8H4B1W8_GIGMA|nr:hypothetical protein F8M41_020071 [Gigaspora margarita]
MPDHMTTIKCSYRKWEKENTLKSKNKEAQLRRISREYGGFYARRLVLGGAIIKETSNDATINYDDNTNSKVRVRVIDDSLQHKDFDILGHRSLKADFNDIPSTWVFSKNAEHVHSLSPQLMGIDKIAKISNCYIFASFIDRSGDFFFANMLQK